MRGVNKVIIVGNLGSDPEVKQFANGGSVTRIAVATSEQWNDKQTGERRTCVKVAKSISKVAFAPINTPTKMA